MIDLIIQSQRPDLKPNSLKIYLTSLRKLNGGNDIKNIDFLKDFDGIVEKISKYKDNTRKNYLNAIIVALKALKTDDKLVKRYEELRDSYNQKYSEHLATHKKTETQEKNWVSWDEYLGMVEKLKDSVQDLRKKKEWDKGDTLRYQNYLLSLLYSNYPLRNDFHDMEVITQRDFKKRSDNKNYLVIQTSKKPKYKIVLNEYKTSAKYKQQVILIDDPILTKAIDTWLSRRSTAGTAFIVSPSDSDRAITSNELTKVLISLSSQWLDGKRVGSSLLRHIYLSDKYSDTLKEQGDDAKLMMHSKSMQEGYIKSD